MTTNEAYNQIKRDTKALYKKIMEIFKAGESHPAFTSIHYYEQFIIDIFKYYLLSLCPDRFLVTYVTGKDYDKVCHAFKSWYMGLANGNIDHWIKVNNLRDEDKYINGLPIKEGEVYHQRYTKALELKNLPNQDALYSMMSIVELEKR